MGFLKNINELFTERAIGIIAESIKECGNKEVLFLGNIDVNDMVDMLTPYAWGNEYSVPSLMKTAVDFDIVVHNHPSGNLEPSDSDIQIANALSNSYGTGFYIVDNLASRIQTVVDYIKKRPVNKIDANNILSYFQEDGLLRKLIKGFEYRIDQKQMVFDIINSFNERKFSVIEAGTGIGKSFAYLIPAILWAKTNKEKIIISTKTINLQQQLIQKDIPILMQDPNLNIEYDFALGRGNFICRRKLAYIMQEDNILYDEDFDTGSMENLIQWAKQSKTGLKSDYISKLDNELWYLISSDYEKCHKIKCPHYEKCFYFEHKRRLSACDLIIINHYLLAYDIFLKNNIISFEENALLPPFRHIIMDEAHHIEDIMSKCFTMEISNIQIYHLLKEIYSPAKKRGILLKLIIRQNHLGPLLLEKEVVDKLSEIKERIFKVQERIQEIHLNIEISYENLIKDIIHYQNESFRNGEIKIRIENEESDYYLMLKENLLSIFNELSNLFMDIKFIYKGYASLPQQILDLMDMDFIILKSIYKRLVYIISVYESFFNLDDERVYWVEYSKRSRHPFFKISNAPILVGDFMMEALYSKLHTFIASSATLNVEDDFRFFLERTGLSNISDDQMIKRVYKSSFLTNEQALLIIPKGLSSPKEEIFYREEVITSIHRILGYLEGGVLILFTSKAFLNEAYHMLKDVIPVFGKIPMKQGDLPRDHQLLEFKSKGNGVLFALDSFWEGIDVPGRSLQTVIITRLPFKSPSDPIEQARYQYIEKQGRNPFYEYALPKAILLLKQGFGRLIRNRSDRGVVLILDNRIIQKRYGKRFLNALPECPRIHDSIDNITSRLKMHFSKE